MSDKITQREWDRIVGIGNPPEDKMPPPPSARVLKEDIPNPFEWTNHKGTRKRHPCNNDKS